jgi:GNAT superfamily N-acetyltransferase
MVVPSPGRPREVLVLIEKVVRHLEMTQPQQLRPARQVAGLEVVRATDPAGLDADRILALHQAIATPHHWSSLGHSSEQWQKVLCGSDRSHWIAVAGDEDIGWASLHVKEGGDVQIASFGLRPDAVGCGYGGAFLTEIVRRAWHVLELPKQAGQAGRVWLATSSWDHPHALANYLGRGFRVARLVLQRQQLGRDHRDSVTVAQPPRFLVRPAVAADAHPVAALLEDLGYRLPVETVHRRLQQFATSADDIIAVVDEQSEQVVGVISAHVVPLLAEADPGFIRITAVSVAPRTRRMGVGRRLVEFVEYVAQTRGISLLEVSSGRRPERQAAHRFYSSLAFQDSATASARYWKDLETDEA